MNGTTHALCRMNMFLHGMDNFRIEWGDVLRNPRLIEGGRLMKFDILAANPPFSLDKWGYDEASADPYHRYHRGLPPKSKGDWAIITHMIETAREGNIPRYVDTFEEEAEIDLAAVKQEIASLESQLATVRAKMADHLKELGL